MAHFFPPQFSTVIAQWDTDDCRHDKNSIKLLTGSKDSLYQELFTVLLRNFMHM